MRTRLFLMFAAAVSGLAALSWEMVWQLKTSLALGVSALGTAITLATTMGGMSLGSLLANRLLGAGRRAVKPLQAYALLELVIGLSGFALAPGFAILERLDASIFQTAPWAAPGLHGLGMVLVLGPPTLALGATIPVYGLLSRQFKVSLATLYGLNTVGAALGCLLVAFWALPKFGVHLTIYLVAGLNLALAVAALACGRSLPATPEPDGSSPSAPTQELLLALLTGFATFSLEVAWFRALRGAFQATTDSFAIMLTSVLLALALGARLSRRSAPLWQFLLGAGIAILVATPVVERFDLLTPDRGEYWRLTAGRLMFSLLVLGGPMALLGAALPRLLENRSNLSDWARLYSMNTLGAILGSVAAAWVLLPTIGFVATAWLVGVLVGVGGLSVAPRSYRPALLVTLGVAWGLAWWGQSGVGTRRIASRSHVTGKIVSFSEGPDTDVAVIEQSPGIRDLFIDGFQASSEDLGCHYMAWMGRVPMLLHPNPKTALVICFGTGQTINGVRQEVIEQADVVDINPRVFENAGLFPANQGVLQDPAIHHYVMDGRAWLRRTTQRYDVVTLEPMPPTFAGVNALYSAEFYQLLTARLNPGGIVTQWLPTHLQGPEASIAIAHTFQSAFPDSILWQDPKMDCVLVGRPGGQGLPPLGAEWPGLRRSGKGRDMKEEEIRASAWMPQAALALYGNSGGGRLVTDDNQLLAYGAALRDDQRKNLKANQRRLELAYNLDLVQQALRRLEGLATPEQEADLLTFERDLKAGTATPDSWMACNRARRTLAEQPQWAEALALLDRLKPPP